MSARVQCPPDSGWLLAVGFVVGSLIAAPITIRFAGMAKHAGALTAPLMSLVNFLQSIDLFRQLQLKWPASIKRFVLYVASFFNLNINLLGIHPECSFHLSFYEKWMLKMMSPVFVILSLAAAIFIRRWVAFRVRNLVRLGRAVKQTGETAMTSLRGTGEGEDFLHLLQPADGRLPSPVMVSSDESDSDAESMKADRSLSTPRPPPRRAPSSVADWVTQAQSPLITGALLDDHAMHSDDMSFRLTQEQEPQGCSMRRTCFKLLGFLGGGIAGAAIGWAFLGQSPRNAAASAIVFSLLGYWLAGRKKKLHTGHEFSSGEDESSATPSPQPPRFLFGDRQFAGLDTRPTRRSVVLHVHAGNDRGAADVIASIGLFENFDVDKVARYEVTLSQSEVRICKFQAGGDWDDEENPPIVAKVEGDLLSMHTDSWIWITVDSSEGTIEIASTTTVPIVGAEQPDGLQSSIVCQDANCLRVSYAAVSNPGHSYICRHPSL